MSMPLANYFTADDVRAMPDDGKRYETVHGELLVTPAPRLSHQYVAGQLFRALADFCDASGAGIALMSPADISLGPDSLVQPDVFVVPRTTDRNAAWHEIGRLLLVAEVLSPRRAHADRFAKRRLYQEQGIPVYWVVDIDARQVEVWTPEAEFPVVERERLVWRHPAVHDECVVELAKLFA
jgi:Uma2 family endonuclease